MKEGKRQRTVDRLADGGGFKADMAEQTWENQRLIKDTKVADYIKGMPKVDPAKAPDYKEQQPDQTRATTVPKEREGR